MKAQHIGPSVLGTSVPTSQQSDPASLSGKPGSHPEHLPVLAPPGSTSTRNSSQKGSSILGVKQRSRRELYVKKLQEHLVQAKNFTIRK